MTGFQTFTILKFKSKSRGHGGKIFQNIVIEMESQRRSQDFLKGDQFQPAAEEVVDMRGAGLTQTCFYSLVR